MVLSDLGGEASASVLPLLLRTQDKFISVLNLADPGQSALGMEYFVFEGDDLWTQSDDALTALGMREIERLGLASARDVRDGMVVRVRKAYPVYDRATTESVATIRRYLEGALGGLQQMGRNGQHRYNNQDHSMATALRAARNVLGEQHDVWDVNEHAEYHETIDRAQPRRLPIPTPQVPCDRP